MLDACDKEQPSSEPSAAATEDLQSRGSIQYTTRVKPDVENEQQQFYNNNEPTRNYIDPAVNSKRQHNMPSVPYALEENLKNDFHRSPPQANHDSRFVHNGYKSPQQSVTQQNATLYTYPSSNYTYGNVPFYMPNGVPYGSPQPMKSSSVYNYPSAPLYNNNNNNYRPIRQPAIPVYHAVQPNPAAMPDQRPMQMVFVHKQPVKQAGPAKHGYRVTGKRLPPNGGGSPMPNGAHHSVVYKKPVYKFNNAQPVPVAAVTHYNPVSPVPQPMIPVQPGGHFQHHYHHQQQQQQQPPAVHQHQHKSFVHQQQPLLQQPSTSVSQSVSVSYSSSKHQKPPQHVLPGYLAPIQNRQEIVGQHHQSHYNGFNHNKVVVEGGFKPIVPTADGSFLQDRSDQESGDVDNFDETAASTMTVRHPEKKMSKKLISRKPAVKHVDPLVTKENAEEQQQDTAVDNTTENVDHENRSIEENAEETKQTTEIVV